VSEATIWSVTLESSIAILEKSFTLIYEVDSTEAILLVVCDPSMNEL
jgi:hypothetical protein